MKKQRFFRFFALAAAVLMLGTGLLCFAARKGSVPALGSGEAGSAVADRFLDALSRGDLAAAQALLLGKPELTRDDPFLHSYSQALWKARQDSFSYDWLGPCQAAGNGLYREVSITTLDPAKVMAAVETLCQLRIREQGIFAGDSAALEAVISQAMEEVLSRSRDAEDFFTTQILTVQLVFQDGQWWVQPEQNLFRLLSGSMVS